MRNAGHAKTPSSERSGCNWFGWPERFALLGLDAGSPINFGVSTEAEGSAFSCTVKYIAGSRRKQIPRREREKKWLSWCHPERSGRSPPQQAKSGRAGDPGSGPRSEGSLLRRRFMGRIGMLRSARPKAGRAPLSMTDAPGSTTRFFLTLCARDDKALGGVVVTQFLSKRNWALARV